MQETWIPILDYAVLKGISTSTLRRYIKANKIPFKVENGRYLLKADIQPPRIPPASNGLVQQNLKQALENPEIQLQQNWGSGSTAESVSVYARVRELEEQVNELKMLVAIYEEKLSHSGH